MTLCKDGLPDRTVWLVIKRSGGAEPAYSSSMRKAPASPPLCTCVWLSGLRWAIEQGFEAGKTELGMDHEEVRKYLGWHHHRLTSRLAHFFRWPLKLRLGKKSPRPDGGAATDVMGSGLAPAYGYDCSGPGVGRVGAEAPSPGVSIPPTATARRRIVLRR